MPDLIPRDLKFATRVSESLNRQAFMQRIGAMLSNVAPGAVDVTLPNDPALHQQHGFVHGGVLISIADSAAGYAALTLAAPATGVLTTELKVNFLRSAEFKRAVARGRVVKPGRTLSVVRCDVFGLKEAEEVHLLTGIVTMMHVDGITD